MYAQKRIVSVTLDIECYEDLDLKNINWNDILGLEGDENVDLATFNVLSPSHCLLGLLALCGHFHRLRQTRPGGPLAIIQRVPYRRLSGRCRG